MRRCPFLLLFVGELQQTIYADETPAISKVVPGPVSVVSSTITKLPAFSDVGIRTEKLTPGSTDPCTPAGNKFCSQIDPAQAFQAGHFSRVGFCLRDRMIRQSIGGREYDPELFSPSCTTKISDWLKTIGDDPLGQIPEIKMKCAPDLNKSCPDAEHPDDKAKWNCLTNIFNVRRARKRSFGFRGSYSNARSLEEEVRSLEEEHDLLRSVETYSEVDHDKLDGPYARWLQQTNQTNTTALADVAGKPVDGPAKPAEGLHTTEKKPTTVLLKQCRRAIFSYQIIQNRNEELNPQALQKCGKALAEFCPMEVLKKEGGNAGGNVNSGEFVAWPLKKRCLRKHRAKMIANDHSDCRAALFRDEVLRANNIAKHHYRNLEDSSRESRSLNDAKNPRSLEEESRTLEDAKPAESRSLEDATPVVATTNVPTAPVPSTKASGAVPTAKAPVAVPTTKAPVAVRATTAPVVPAVAPAPAVPAAAVPPTAPTNFQQANPASLSANLATDDVSNLLQGENKAYMHQHLLLAQQCTPAIKAHCLTAPSTIDCLLRLARKDISHEMYAHHTKAIRAGLKPKNWFKHNDTEIGKMTVHSVSNLVHNLQNKLHPQGQGNNSGAEKPAGRNLLDSTNLDSMNTLQDDEAERMYEDLDDEPELEDFSSRFLLEEYIYDSDFSSRFLLDENTPSGILNGVASVPKIGGSGGFDPHLVLTKKCRDLVQEAVNRKSQDIRLNPVIQEKCMDDIQTLCGKQYEETSRNPTSSGTVMHCLRRRYYEISSQDCVDAFRGTVKQMQMDWRADKVTKEACKTDKEVFCPFVKPELVHQCLQEHVDELEVDCQQEEFLVANFAAVDVENFNPYMKRMCLLDLDKHCTGADTTSLDIAEGSKSTRVLLESVRLSDEKDTFEEANNSEIIPKKFFAPLRGAQAVAAATATKASAVSSTPGGALKCLKKVPRAQLKNSCSVALRNSAVRTGVDYRLKFGVSQYCGPAIQELCEDKLPQTTGQISPKGAVLTCLVQNREKIQEKAKHFYMSSAYNDYALCAESITQIALEMKRDVNAAAALKSACETDISTYCSTVEPNGMGNVHQCLVKNLSNLSEQCAEEELSLQSATSGRLSLSPTLKNCCKETTDKYCATVRDEKGAKIQCLISHKKQAPFSCKQCISKHVRKQNRDYRLSPILRKECKNEIESPDICGGAKDTATAGSGVVIQCLIDKRKQISANAGCLHAVQRKIAQRAEDYRVLPFFHTSCEEDIVAFCGEVAPGSGRVHACLQQHFKDLSQSCKQLEFRNMENSIGSNVKLDPSIAKFCTSAWTPEKSPCKGTSDGDMFQCLWKHRDDSSFINSQCRIAIQTIQVKKSGSLVLNDRAVSACQRQLNALIKFGKCEPGTEPIETSGIAGNKSDRRLIINTEERELQEDIQKAEIAAKMEMVFAAHSLDLVPDWNLMSTLGAKAGIETRLDAFRKRRLGENRELATPAILPTASSNAQASIDQPGQRLRCLIDNFAAIALAGEKQCYSILLRTARAQVINPFRYRPGFEDTCSSVLQSSCKGLSNHPTAVGIGLNSNNYQPVAKKVGSGRSLTRRLEEEEVQNEPSIMQLGGFGPENPLLYYEAQKLKKQWAREAAEELDREEQNNKRRLGEATAEELKLEQDFDKESFNGRKLADILDSLQQEDAEDVEGTENIRNLSAISEQEEESQQLLVDERMEKVLKQVERQSADSSNHEIEEYLRRRNLEDIPQAATAGAAAILPKPSASALASRKHVGTAARDSRPWYSKAGLDVRNSDHAVGRRGRSIVRLKMNCLASLPQNRFTSNHKEQQCITEVEKVKKLSSGDIRLHPFLQTRCANEIAKFCGHLKAGNSRILTCLKAELEAYNSARATALSVNTTAALSATNLVDKTSAGPSPTALSDVSPFSPPCELSIARIYISEEAVGAYSKSGLSAGMTAKLLDSLGLLRGGKISFLTLRGPVALAAMIALVLILILGCYFCVSYQIRASQTESYYVGNAASEVTYDMKPSSIGKQPEE